MRNFYALVALALLLPMIAFAADLNITWPAAPASEQVTSYEIWVGTNGTPAAYSSNAVATTTGTNYTLADVPEGNVYSVQIKAVNLAGESPLSDAGSTPGLPTKPGAPTVEVVP